MLVLEAMHATDKAATGIQPVDEVSTVLSALPFGERCSMESLISPDAGTSQPGLNLAEVCSSVPSAASAHETAIRFYRELFINLLLLKQCCGSSYDGHGLSSLCHPCSWSSA